MAGMTARSRNKGFGYERRLVKLFRELGYNCTTSRFSSKSEDYLGVDLCGLPFNVQAKAVEKLGPLHPILANMPKRKGQWNFVFHKKNRQGTVVAMSEEHFLEMLKLMIEAGIVSTEC